MAKKERYVFFHPIKDERIRTEINEYLDKRGGMAPLGTLRIRIGASFKGVIETNHAEEELYESPDLREARGLAYILESGMVYRQ